MSAINPDQPKKNSSMFEKLGQRFTTIKGDIVDIADTIERRRQLYNHPINNQVHFITRPNEPEDSLIIEKSPPTPPEVQTRQASGKEITIELYSIIFQLFLGDDSSISERSFSFSQFTSSFGKKLTNDTSSEITHSHSSQDLFSTENNDQAKDMIMNDVRQEFNRSRNRVASDSSDDFSINKLDHISTSIGKTDKNKRKSTLLLAGPKFRSHTIESKYDLKRDTIYPVSVRIFELQIFIFFSYEFSALLVLFQ
jgi:hypothetical protein